MSIEFTGPNGYRCLVEYQGMYSDGTPMIKMDIDDVARNANSITVRPASLMEFVTAMFIVDALDVHLGGGGHPIIRLVLPYLPGARQDRINREGDVLLSSFSVAEMINMREFDEVICVDPHSPFMPSLVTNGREFPLELLAKKVWGGYTGVIAPDKGAKARAEAFAKVLDKPIFYGEKTRDVSTGRLSGFSIDVPEGGHYLVVDDICDGGGTFVGLGEKIKECGAYADLFVTHGIFSKGTDDLRKIYKNIYTTDSLSHNAHGIYTIPIVADMENH